VSIGETQQFNASGTDQYGNPFPVNPVWTATGGTINSTGLFTADSTLGQFTVTAMDNAVSGEADVDVSTREPTAEAGGPYAGVAGATITLDGSASFDPNNDIISYDWDFDDDGVFDDASGEIALFTSSVPGVFVVGLEVTDSEGSSDTDTATVTVGSSPVLTQIVVTPDPVDVVMGASMQFTASGFDQYGNPIAANPLWTATGGAIDAAGLFTAAFVAGQFIVTATDGTVFGEAGVTIIDPPAQPEEYLLFDGVDDFIEIPDSAALDLNVGEFTLSAWILPTSWGENNQGRIIDHGGGSGGANGWSLHLENKVSRGSPQALRMQINNSSSFNGTSDSGVLVINAWQHVAVTLTGGTMTFYVDGVESGIRTGVPTPVASGDVVRVGQRTADTKRTFDGNIDEVRIWDRALSAAEIQANMNADLSGSEPGLVEMAPAMVMTAPWARARRGMHRIL
jgi:hypothetical protein